MADTFHNIYESPCNHAVCLLARVQLIEPKEAVWAVAKDAVTASSVAMMRVASHICRCAAIEVLGWVVVDVSEL